MREENGGEYYTPRPLIKTIVKIVAPVLEIKFMMALAALPVSYGIV